VPSTAAQDPFPRPSSGHRSRGWAGKKNGDLLRAASGVIDVFITVDSNLAYQQPIAGLPFAVIVLRAHSNRLADIVELVPRVVEELAAAKPGLIVRVGG
jgi:hypothetical protein